MIDILVELSVKMGVVADVFTLKHNLTQSEIQSILLTKRCPCSSADFARTRVDRYGWSGRLLVCEGDKIIKYHDYN